MDPVTLILAALAAGAAAGVTDVAKGSITDAYTGLKRLLSRRFGDGAVAQGVLAGHEADPVTFDAPMRQQLEASGAAADPEILTQAEALVADADRAGIKTDYTVNVTGNGNITVTGKARVGIIGDHGTVHM